MRSTAFVLAFVLVSACGGAAPTAAPSFPPTAAPTAAPTQPVSASSAPTLAPPTAAPPAGSAPLCASDWSTSPGTCGGSIGDTFLFQCPPGGRTTAVYGTDTYTDDSSACVAAVHAGLIDFISGGAVTIQLTPGLDAYAGTTRNGVESNSWGSWGTSFVFIGGAVAQPTPVGEGPPPADAAILAHIPAAMNVNCYKVTTLSAGEITAASCGPPNIDGYVTYVLFDTSQHLQDKFFGDFDYFGVDQPGSDCNAGPCLVAWIGSTGLSEGRYFHNSYAGIDPNGFIAYWFDESLLIEGGMALNSGTFADLYSLALGAGPVR
jgi:hypothetical protein